MMTTKHILLTPTAKGNITLDQYPEGAWDDLLTGGSGDSRKQVDAAMQYYEAVALLFRCVRVRADSIARIPWSIQRNGQDVWTSAERTPPPQLEYLANLRMLLRLTEAALCLSPEAFWFKERNRVRVLGLRWHAPSTVVPQWSSSSGLTGFKRILGNGESRTFAVDDYVYFALPNAFHETMPGRPPGQAVMTACGVLYNIDRFATNFFSRGAIKATLLTIDGNPQPQEMQRLEAWWKKFFSGMSSAWETAAVRAGVKPVVVGEGISELGNKELTDDKKKEILSGMGVPHSLVMSDAANYATAKQDDVHFYDKTIIPEAELLSETINAQLLASAGMELVFKPQEMNIFQADEAERADAWAKYVSNGMPPSIATRILGIELPAGIEPEMLDVTQQDAQTGSARSRDADGDGIIGETPGQASGTSNAAPPGTSNAAPPDTASAAPMLDTNANTRALPLDGHAAEVARFRRWAKKRIGKNAAPNDFASDVLGDDEKAELWQAMASEADDDARFFTLWTGSTTPDSAASVKAMILQLDDGDPEAEHGERVRIERKVQANIEKALAKQQRVAERTAKELSAKWGTPDYAEQRMRLFEEDMFKEMRNARIEYDMQDELRRALLQSVDLGTAVTVKQFESIGMGFDYTLANEQARQWADAYAGQLITDIDATTLRRTRDSITAWIENGEQFSRLVEDLTTIFGPGRAELIASTEVTRAYAEAARLNYLAAGVTKWTWRTAVGERVCPVCGALEGAVVSIDTAWNGFLPDEAQALARQQFTAPPAHPRCRCFVAPYVETPRR